MVRKTSNSTILFRTFSVLTIVLVMLKMHTETHADLHCCCPAVTKTEDKF